MKLIPFVQFKRITVGLFDAGGRPECKVSIWEKSTLTWFQMRRFRCGLTNGEILCQIRSIPLTGLNPPKTGSQRPRNRADFDHS